MKKLTIYLIIGLILLFTGLIILNFAGHKQMTKGFLLILLGFILSGASGMTLYQFRKRLSKKEPVNNILDQQQDQL